jgi:hypothetical protein
MDHAIAMVERLIYFKVTNTFQGEAGDGEEEEDQNVISPSLYFKDDEAFIRANRLSDLNFLPCPQPVSTTTSFSNSSSLNL